MDGRFTVGDYVVVQLYGTIYQPGYISRVNNNDYDVDVCMLSLDKKHIERFSYQSVKEDMIRAS